MQRIDFAVCGDELALQQQVACVRLLESTTQQQVACVRLLESTTQRHDLRIVGA
jgi:hypothetical protein